MKYTSKLVRLSSVVVAAVSSSPNAFRILWVVGGDVSKILMTHALGFSTLNTLDSICRCTREFLFFLVSR